MTDEERLLVRRCEELRERANGGSPAFSQFLSPRECVILRAFGLLSPDVKSTDELAGLDTICFFWGGYPDAERVVYCALPSYFAYSIAAEPDSDIIPAIAGTVQNELSEIFVPLRIKTSGYVNLTHRDFLGSLLALGIDRRVIGDIVIDDDGAIVFAAVQIAGYIKSELTTIGRDKVKVADTSLPDGFAPKREFEAVSATLASARLDAVVSELARTSRETAKELIRRGLVEHNYFTADEPDSPVVGGDVISIKRESRIRFGKYIIDRIDEQTSKGRLKLAARKYI